MGKGVIESPEYNVSLVQNETIHVTTKYILLLYGAKARNCSSLDELRYKFARTSDRPGCQFPPTNDAFWQHVLRANYQVSLWVHSHLAQPLLLDHAGNGWKIWSDGDIQQVMFFKNAGPVELRDITHLYCNDTDCHLKVMDRALTTRWLVR